VLTVCGCHAAGNEVSRQARQQQQHYLLQLGWTAAAAFPATPAAWVYNELSWWGLKSALPLHVAHMHFAVTTALDLSINNLPSFPTELQGALPV
jgi:hypothetical protein